MESAAGGVEFDGEGDEIKEDVGTLTDGDDDEVGVRAETSEAREDRGER